MSRGEEAGQRQAFRLRVRAAAAGAPVRWEVALDALLPQRSGAWADPDTWQLAHEGRAVPLRADVDTLDGRRHTVRFRVPAAGDLTLEATCLLREGPRPAPPVPPDRPVPLVGAGEEIGYGSTAAVGDLHAGLQTGVEVVDWYGRGRLDLLLTYHGHEGGAHLYAATGEAGQGGEDRPRFRRAGRIPGFGDDRQGANSRVRAVDFGGLGGQRRFDLLECRGSRILWHRNTGQAGAPQFAPPLPLEAGGAPFDTGSLPVPPRPSDRWRAREPWTSGGTGNPGIRVQSLCTVDLGDGQVSLIVGTNDWSDYWPKDVGAWEDKPGYRPYEADGSWRGGPLRGRLFLLRGAGPAGARGPALAAPVELCHEDGTPLEVYGLAGPAILPAHEPGAGFDLVVSDFLDRLWYFRDTGRRGPHGAPRFAPRTPVRSTGEPAPEIDRSPTAPFAPPPDYPPLERLPDELVLPTCMHALAVVTWPVWQGGAGGATDFLVGAEDGYVRALRLVRRTAEGVPVVGPPARLQEYGAHLSVGAKACPNVVDWDGDGQQELVIGNAAGQVLLSRRVDAPGAEGPVFARPEPFLAGDRPLWLMAGAPGTMQGPSEVRWGYINPGVGRWDAARAPGALDIVCGDSLGHNTLYRGVAAAGGAPRVERGRRLHLLREGGWVPLVTRWRCRPQLVDWGSGQTEYLQVDDDGKLARYRLLPDGPVAEDGQARVQPIDRLRHPDGSLLQLDSDFGGRIGRLKLAVVDWDGDGLPDLLMGGSGTQPMGVNTLRKSSVFLLRNVGRPGEPLLARPELVALEAGEPARFGGHSCVPAPCLLDGARGLPDLLVGSENGRIYAYRRTYIDAAATLLST